MKAVERQRKKLYHALEQGLKREKILSESQKLDKLILIEQKRLLKLKK